MNTDAFSQCHPAVSFTFFLGAIVFGATIQHPAYLIVGIVSACTYYLLLYGKNGMRRIGGLLPFFLILAAINPLFNTSGQQVLFRIFGRPYTFEALLYGAAISGIFAVMVIWFGCYQAVMTGDKFTSLFGNWIPSLSLLLVMVFRMVPNLIKKAAQIAGARKAIGKNTGSSRRERLKDGFTVLSALVSLALEGGIITGDSMRSRGYGSAKRTSFQIYRMKATDWALLLLLLTLAAAVAAAAVLGGTKAAFTPEFSVAPIAGCNAFGLAAYCGFALIPTALHIKEALQWRISRSKI